MEHDPGLTPARYDTRPLKNPEHEAYCRYRAMGCSIRVAWNRMRGKSDDSKSGYNGGNRLEARPEISYRIGQLEAEAARKTTDAISIDQARVVQGWIDVYENCATKVQKTVEDGTLDLMVDPKGAKAALDSIAKHLGMFEHKRQSDPLEKLEDAQLKNVLVGLLTELGFSGTFEEALDVDGIRAGSGGDPQGAEEAEG